MITTKTRHHEGIALLPQIAGYCYVAGSIAAGLIVGWIKGNKKPDNENPVDE